jgi:hemoglobin-like flavoprotein
MLNAVYNTQTEPAPVVQKNDNQIWADFWQKIFSKRPDLMRKFRQRNIGYFLDILYNKNLSEVQKFEKIFGVQAVDLKQFALNGLGDIFTEISNFFSQENLKKIENGIRQGQSVSNSIANAINALRNQGNFQNANELTEIRDQQSKLYFGAQSFYEKYGPAMLLIGGGLLFITLLKKK